jgi:hypothetical protein
MSYGSADYFVDNPSSVSDVFDGYVPQASPPMGGGRAPVYYPTGYGDAPSTAAYNNHSPSPLRVTGGGPSWLVVILLFVLAAFIVAAITWTYNPSTSSTGGASPYSALIAALTDDEDRRAALELERLFTSTARPDVRAMLGEQLGRMVAASDGSQQPPRIPTRELADTVDPNFTVGK